MLSLHFCLNIWFLSGFLCADWLLLSGCYVALTSVVVCVGVMHMCGRLRTGGGRGFRLLEFQKCVEDLVGEDS